MNDAGASAAAVPESHLWGQDPGVGCSRIAPTSMQALGQGSKRHQQQRGFQVQREGEQLLPVSSTATFPSLLVQTAFWQRIPLILDVQSVWSL